MLFQVIFQTSSVAVATSMFSYPSPARPTILSRSAPALSTFRVTLVAERTISPSKDPIFSQSSASESVGSVSTVWPALLRISAQIWDRTGKKDPK